MRLPQSLCARIAAAVAALCAAVGVQAASPSEETARIQNERREVAARFATASSACQGHFVVTACLDQARHERRVALDDLNRQQQVLSDAQRRDRAAQRAQSIAQKAEQADARDAAPVASPANPGTAAAPASAPAVRTDKAQRRKAKATPNARKVEKAEKRRLEAERHRLDVERRNAESLRKRPAAAGLPVPGAASAPR